MEEPSSNRRLDSWKEIAEFLGRDVRTVIRWEKEKELPIHRLPGGKRQAVFAFTQEIHVWMLGQSEKSETVAELNSSSQTPAATAAAYTLPSASRPGWASSRTARRLGVWLATAALLLLGGVFLRSGRTGARTTQLPPLLRPLKFSRSDYRVAAPRGIVAGDFNSDGNLDLASTDSNHGSIVVLLGDGHGAFPQRLESPTFLKSPEHIAVGDFNGDGRLDVVLTSFFGGREIEVLLGNGDGTFRQHVHYDVGGRSRWVAVGDLNDDGKLDLAAAASAAGQVVVRFGNGDGTFSDGGRYEAERDVSALALADFNGDGKLDIAAGNYRQATGGSLAVYFNKGDGTFLARQNFASGTGPLGLAAADLNGDGKLDLVSANFPASGSILLGAGAGKFAEPIAFDAGRGNGFVAVGDLDRDGVPDLLVLGEHSSTATILHGNGGGGVIPGQNIHTGEYPDGAVIADFDGDRRLDFAVLNTYGNSISVFLNQTEPVTARSWFARSSSGRFD